MEPYVAGPFTPSFLALIPTGIVLFCFASYNIIRNLKNLCRCWTQVMSLMLTGSLMRWGLRVMLSCGREFPRGRLSSEEVFVRSTDTGNSWVSRESHTLVYHLHLFTPPHHTFNPDITLNTDSTLCFCFPGSIPHSAKY